MGLYKLGNRQVYRFTEWAQHVVGFASPGLGVGWGVLTHVGCYGMLWCSRDLIRWYSLHLQTRLPGNCMMLKRIQFPWAWTHVGCYGPACLAGSVVTFPELPQNFVELNCSSVDVFDYCYWTCQEVKNKPLRCTWRALSSEQVVCTAWATSCSRIFVSYLHTSSHRD